MARKTDAEHSPAPRGRRGRSNPHRRDPAPADDAGADERAAPDPDAGGELRPGAGDGGAEEAGEVNRPAAFLVAPDGERTEMRVHGEQVFRCKFCHSPRYVPQPDHEVTYPSETVTREHDGTSRHHAEWEYLGGQLITPGDLDQVDCDSPAYCWACRAPARPTRDGIHTCQYRTQKVKP